MKEQMCSEKVWRGYHYYACGAKAKVVRDDKPYCGRHDPEKVAERQAAREVKYKVAVEADRAKRVAEKERERRADCFEGMLEALETIRRIVNTPPQTVADESIADIANTAIANAKGES